MTTYCCEYCNKKYVKKSFYNNHVISCKLSRQYTSKEELLEDNDIDILNVNNFDNKTIIKLLLNLHNKYEKLQSDYDELKKYVVIRKNKINIIDYLNENFDYSDCDFYNFINSIIIDNDKLNLIFKNDYVNGCYQILFDYIENLKLNNQNVPFKAFTNKEGIIYIYVNDYSWIIMDEFYINKLINTLNKQLLTQFNIWKDEIINNISDDDYQELYIINMKKILGSNFNNKNIKIMIKNKLYKYIRTNIKNIVSYDFD